MPTLTVDPMTPDELSAYRSVQLTDYIQQRVEFGGEDVADATRIAHEQHGQFFPDGQPAPGHHLFIGRAATGNRVGLLWLFERSEPGTGTGAGAGADTGTVFIYDIEVDEAVRGQGWGRELMHFVETWSRARGAARVELNVFGGNAIARHLYTALGYTESAVHMTKKLTEQL